MRCLIFLLALLVGAAHLTGAAAQDSAPKMKQQKRGTSPAQNVTPAQTVTPAQSPAPQAPNENIPFIDAHAHLNDETMQLDMMNRYGARRAVVFWGRASDNESVAAAAARHPDRFIAFASISPERRTYRPAWDGDGTALLKELDDLLASGRFKGIGEISATHFPSANLPEADYSPMSPMVQGIMQLAQKHRMPVLFHVELTRLREFSSLLETYPDVGVIWAHGGYTPLFLAQRMLEKHPNLTYELSARTWPRHPRSPDYTILRDGTAVWPQWLALIEAMPERFIVGTDASHNSQGSEIMKFESVQNFLQQLSPATREHVAETNLLKLVEPTR